MNIIHKHDENKNDIFNKDENVSTCVTKKNLTHCSQPLFPNKFIDLFYSVESHKSG